MTAVGYVVRLFNLTVGTETGVECAVTGARLRPTVNVVTSQTACPDGQLADASDPVWTFEVAYNSDPAADSFSTYLADNVGDVVAVEWTPDPTNAPSRTRYFNVRIVPGDEGGDVGAYATATVSLPVIGQPSWTDPTP